MSALTTTTFHGHKPSPTFSEQQPTSSMSSNSSTTSSNSLYLYTFLTTLLLLLAVSCGIIFRSFVLRRRFRQRVEEAIAAGVLLPDGRLAPGLNGGRRGYDFGAKPIMYDIWMEYHSGPKAEQWADLKPVSATVIRNTVVTPPATLDLPTPTNATPPHGRFNPRTLVQSLRSVGFVSNGRRARTPQPSQNLNTSPIPTVGPQGQLQPPSPQVASEPTTTPGASDNLILSVLIAMPNPSRPSYVPGALQLQPPIPLSLSGNEQETLSVKGKSKVSTSPSRSHDDEEELPDVVFGVSELLWTKEMEVQEQPLPSSTEDRDAERRA